MVTFFKFFGGVIMKKVVVLLFSFFLLPISLSATDFVSFGGFFDYTILLANQPREDISSTSARTDQVGLDSTDARVKETLGLTGYGGHIMMIGLQISYYNNNPVGFYVKFNAGVPTGGQLGESEQIDYNNTFRSAAASLDTILGVSYMLEISEDLSFYVGGGFHSRVLNLVSRGGFTSLATADKRPFLYTEEITYIIMGAAANIQISWLLIPSFRLGGGIDVVFDFASLTEELRDHFKYGISFQPAFYFSFVI